MELTKQNPFAVEGLFIWECPQCGAKNRTEADGPLPMVLVCAGCKNRFGYGPTLSRIQ